jgi:hypothetical protein
MSRFFVGYSKKVMVSYTREILIKSIVASEMVNRNGENYHKDLKDLYHKWEHESSENLCKKYNEINMTNLNLSSLIP